MSILHAVVLGLVQGLSEFLPISSSGHLELTRWLFGWGELDTELETTFDVAVHLGTLVGALAYLRRDVARLTVAGLGPLVRRRPWTADGRIAWALVVSAVPAGVVGVLFEEQLRGADRIWLIAVMLIVFGVVLGFADRLRGTRGMQEFGWWPALAMGLGQALALQPGVSRSGATITVGRILGFSRDATARLAFLMSLPVIAGAGVLRFAEVSVPSSFWPPFVVGIVTSALTGYLAVWGTLVLVRTRTFGPFIAYRVVLGAAVLALLASPWR